MPIAADLAVFSGPKTVTIEPPKWPHFNDAEIEAVRQCLLRSREDWREACSAFVGPTVEALEKRFAEWLGRKHALSTSGGGPALHIACMAAGVELGDEVITTPYSWGQTVSCILQAGGVPIFGDIDPETLQLDPDTIEPLITEQTKAIVVVHLLGAPAEIDRIMAIADKHNLMVIEDCAQAQGALYHGKLVGTQGHLSCFSIGSGKNIAAGDGGMLVTDDRYLYEKAVLAGMHPGRMGPEVQIDELKQRVDSLIYTYRINVFTAALALRQMDRLDEMIEWRRRNYNYLSRLLKHAPGIRAQKLPSHAEPAWHMTMWTFVADDLPGVTRAQYAKALQAEGAAVGAGYVGTPIHLRPTFANKQWWLGGGYPWKANPRGDQIQYRAGDCPVAERRCAELDMNMGAWPEDVSQYVEQIAEAFAKVAASSDRLCEIKV